jgi:hypothetical protein
MSLDTVIPGSGQLVGNIVSDGTKMYASSFAVCFAWNPDLQPYLSAPVSGGPWTALPGPVVTQGGALAYDADHHVLYSSNCQDGLRRVVLVH